MNTLFKHLKKEASQIRLESSEKRAMLERLYEAQYGSSTFPHLLPIRSPYWRFLAPRLAAYSLVGVLVVGIGTVSAAQGALPGDILYPVKVNIAEPLEAALAVSQSGKAEANARFAERRVREIEVLAERGTLDATTTEQVARNFEYHADQVEIHAKGSDSEESRAFTTEVADSLDELGSTLERASEHGSNEEAKRNSKDFAERVRSRAWSMKHLEPDDEDNSGPGTASTTSDDDGTSELKNSDGENDENGENDGDNNGNNSGKGGGENGEEDKDDDGTTGENSVSGSVEDNSGSSGEDADNGGSGSGSSGGGSGGGNSGSGGGSYSGKGSGDDSDD